MPKAREYETAEAASPFGQWFEALTPGASARVATTVTKLEAGLKPHVKSVGKGVHEAKIDFGPGYRVYSPSTERS